MLHFSGNKGKQPLPTAPNPEEEVRKTAPAPNQSDAEADKKSAEIEAQRLAFVRKNPDFDMKAEMENSAFVNYVWGNGLTVEEAYFLVHREELLKQAASEAVEAFLQKRDKIPENGTVKTVPAIAKKNPKDLSDKEVDAIIERARNGETISF